MINKYITYILMVLLSVGCSDEFGLSDRRGIQYSGMVELTFSVPAATVVNTRATDEYQVNDITVLIFNGNGNDATLKQEESFSDDNLISLENNKYKVSLKLDDNIKTLDNLQFYFIANLRTGVSFQKETTLSTVLAQQSETVVKSDQLVMSGHSSLSELTTTEIPLYRNGAKVTVSNAVTDETEVPFFSIFGAAPNSSIFAGYLSNNSTNNNTKEGCGSPSTINSSDFPKEIDNTSATYCHPTLNTAGNEGKTFIIVKAKYQEKDYFYRLDLKQKKTKEDSTTAEEEEVYLDLLPNHWYQVMIESVDAPGYTTPEEASKHPISLITYDIHDHAPVIFNMVSDGIRELGVTHEVTYTNGITTENEWSEKYIDIKCFSIYDNELTSLPNELNITTEEGWLEINETPSDITNSESGIDGTDVNYNSKDKDYNNRGKIFRYNLRFKKTEELGTLYGNINVTWKGLSRKIPVTWERSFSGDELCSVKLKMFNTPENDTDPVVTIDDYWNFLSSTDPTFQYSGTRLWGIAPNKNNGKIRNQGLHFPLMYGDPGKTDEKRWRYEYEVDMTALKDYDFDWTVKIDGDATITDHMIIKVNGSEISSGHHPANSSLIFTISRPGNAYTNAGSTDGELNDYTYGIGKFILNVTPTQRVDEPNSRLSNEYSFDLYHTGFFHHPKFSYKNGETVPIEIQNDDFYYYEVVPIKGETRMRYWLDRNLGAKSAKMYIEASGGIAYDGDPEASGGYYKVAEYSVYNNPPMITTLAPPGYRVPQQKVWDAMRNSERFHTEVSGNHFESYYEVDPIINTKIGKVYFPKAMMRTNDGGKIGESRAGYYWTSTASTGTEKEEIGRWLKTLVISGSSTSYINGNVETYRASVRCINDIPDNNTPQRFSFNVNGATHVYLYRVDKDDSEGKTKVPTTTWPGHVIGNYVTMKDGWFNFSYETADFDPDIHELYVIFNFLDKDGIIHTMSKETISDPTMQTLITPLNAKGWKVIGDNSGELFPTTILDFHTGDPTDVGYWWNCNYTSQTVYCFKEALIAKSCRIYWKKNLDNGDNNYPYARIDNVPYNHTGEENEYYYLDICVNPSKEISFYFCKDDKSTDDNNTYKASGKVPWKGTNDFENINNIYYYTVFRYDIAYSGKPKT